MALKADFEAAVKQDLGEGEYKAGIQALVAVDRRRIQLSNPRQCHGSADIDNALKKSQPDSRRWDYVVAVDKTLHFIEVHPAHSSEVKDMAAKKSWLDNWLKNSQLNRLAAPKHYHWVASDKVAIPKGSKQWRAAVQMGLKPVTGLKL